MIDIALFEPEIPPNTGNIMRLCANTGARLHLIEPLGFDLDEKKLRRAGLDYRDQAIVQRYPDFPDFLERIDDRRLLALSTRCSTRYSDTVYQDGDILLFGPETRGLPDEVLESLPGAQRLRIPMRADSRSMNLSNAAAVVLYEALRQQGFTGLC